MKTLPDLPNSLLPFAPAASAAAAVPPRDEMLNKEELAARLKVAVRTIENWQHDGHLPFLKISNVILFYWPTVVDHLQRHFTVCRGGAVRPTGKLRPEN